MTPYYDEDGITIYHGDCREILPTLTADLLVTDPPYVGLTGGYVMDQSGIGAQRHPSTSIADPWSASLDWFDVAWSSVNLGALVFASYHFVAELGTLLPQSQRSALLTWHQPNGVPRGANVPRYTSEFIWAFRKAPGLAWHKLNTTVYQTPRLSSGAVSTGERLVGPDGRVAHPAQKPLNLMQWLLGVGGESVLDPFMGTGTTLRAAKDLGRRAIGIEVEERYCEIAVQRLAQGVLSFG